VSTTKTRQRRTAVERRETVIEATPPSVRARHPLPPIFFSPAH
jgi:hypothetical protein